MPYLESIMCARQKAVELPSYMQKVKQQSYTQGPALQCIFNFFCLHLFNLAQLVNISQHIFN